MNKDLKFLLKTVKKANKIVDEKFMVEAKDDNNDLITDFDLRVEKFIIEEIRKQYPDFEIISEEFNTNTKECENYFTIDPIDGTINFAYGIPLWGIQVAMVKDFKTCASVIYLPKINELYYADETGAYSNGKLLDLSKLKISKNSLIDQYYLDDEQAFINELTPNVPANLKARRFRKFYCACASYSWLASGKMGAVIFAKHLPWDYTPGMYLVKQAKGAIDTFKFNGKPYYIACANQQLLKQINDAIKRTQN